MSAEPYRSPTLQARRAQMFPVLADEELARLRRFGEPRRYADGECLFETGKTSPDEKGFVTTGGGRLPLEIGQARRRGDRRRRRGGRADPRVSCAGERRGGGSGGLVC